MESMQASFKEYIAVKFFDHRKALLQHLFNLEVQNSMPKQIYLISGLGADKRVFENIALPNFRLHHIEWVEPLKNESIESYAKRLSVQIKTANPILIGVYLGGVITEIIILISSMFGHHP